MNNKLTFIVVSMIYLSEKPLSYSATRSVYSPEERALQTKETLLSIREKVPDAQIILLESGLKKDLPHNISSLADSYLYIGNKPLVRYACDGPFKGFGEIISILEMRKHIIPERDYFKISGRYYLNERFNINDWKDGDFNLRFRDPKSFSTVFYKFKGKAFKILERALFLTIPLCFLNRSIERTIFRFIPSNKIKKVEHIGVSGFVAVDGGVFSE
jgi:hypothetical protein